MWALASTPTPPTLLLLQWSVGLLPNDILPEVAVNVGPIALTPYAAPGTDEVPRSLEPYIKDHDAFLLRNHGLVTVGRTVKEAHMRHETVEQLRLDSLSGPAIGDSRDDSARRPRRLEGIRLKDKSNQETAEGK